MLGNLRENLETTVESKRFDSAFDAFIFTLFIGLVIAMVAAWM